MTSFRVHIEGQGAPITVEAANPDQARARAQAMGLGIVRKVKLERVDKIGAAGRAGRLPARLTRRARLAQEART